MQAQDKTKKSCHPQLRRMDSPRSEGPGTRDILRDRMGNQGMLRIIQAKLSIGATNDPLEAEADRVAEQVLRMPGPSLDRPSTDPTPICPLHIQRLSPNCEEELQRRVQDVQTETATSGLDSVATTLRQGGHPLDANTRNFFEPRFGVDFSNVRIHTGTKATESAKSINALAYTVGCDVVFNSGQYAPHHDSGKRLLAHELTHVVQQGGSDVNRVGLGNENRGLSPIHAPVIQRQPNLSVLPPDSSVGATSPGYDEAAHAPSFHVRIVAHASPRWRGARGVADADRRNLELSQRRADAVRIEVEKLLAGHLGAGASVTVDVTVEELDPGTVGLEAEARGSRDTLPEAKGDRSDNALQRRRVDVIIESSQRVSGLAGASRPLLTMPTATQHWHVSVDMSAGGAVGVAGALLRLTLTNDSSGQTMHGTVWAAGGGTKASLGTSASIWSDPTWFYTDKREDFSDFAGTWVRYTSAGVSLFLGYEKAYISFIGHGSEAQSINVGGWNTGTVGAGGSVVSGVLSLDGAYPPTRIPIKDTDKTVTHYERTEHGEDVHSILFSTESDTFNDLEVDILNSFLASVVASKR